MTDTATETAPAPTPTVRPIVVDILAAHEDWAYLLHPELPVRQATAEELAAVEDRAHAEYEAFLAVPVSPEPHPPMCACNRKEAAPEPEPAAVTVPELAAAQPVQDDPAPVLSPIAELALSRFEAAHAAEDERTATTQLAAVGDDTAVIEGDAK